VSQQSEEAKDDRPDGTPVLTRLFSASFIIPFCVCLLTWMVLSGKFDSFHLSLGVISCTIVAWLSGEQMVRSRDGRWRPGELIRFIAYVPWLLYQIMLANLHVMKLVFHPRMMDHINPQIITFQTRLNGEMARFVFANSITLTPGTITVFASIMGTFTVHAIDDASAEALPGEMEERVARIYGE